MGFSFAEKLMKKLAFPEVAVERLKTLAERIAADGEAMSAFASAEDGYMSERIELDAALEATAAAAERLGEEHPYAAHMLFLLSCAEELWARYEETGLSEEVFLNTMDDFNCKLRECMKVKGEVGSFVPGWYDGFFRMTRFGLGRLQFERRPAPEELDGYTEKGLTLHTGDTVINIHIPSSGPLTGEKRRDAYRRAFGFFKDERRDGKLAIVCSSWLLYPPYRKVFGEGSNVVGFQDDFTRLFQHEADSFKDAWRVFGADAEKAPDELPRTTRMQRSFAEWLKNGGSAGYGTGVFVMTEDE